MTEPLDVLILDALMTHLTDPALTDPATPIAYPQLHYEPTPGTAYLDVRPILRATPDHPWLSFSDPTTYRGVFQVDAITPDGAGVAPGLRLASTLAARFPIGTSLTVDGNRLQLTEVPYIGPMISDAPWLRHPVSISYLVTT